MLIGAAGIGKTTIVAAAVARAGDAGLRVWWARPAAGEMELPYAGLADLLSASPTGALARLPAPQRSAIEAALARSGAGAAVDEHALSRGALELLKAEAAGGDLLLVIDDIQWLDRPTASALSFALRRSGPAPLRVLVAERTEDGSGPELPLGLGEWEHVRASGIGPLSVTELGVLIRERTGDQLTRPHLEALHRASGGNPMLALELARREPGSDGGTPALPIALEERLRSLDPDTLAALQMAAAALRPSTDLLLRAGVDRPALRSSIATGILEADGERLSFAHPMLAEAAYGLLLPDERRDVHARLASASTDIVERGHHISRSQVDPDAEAAAVLDEAAAAAANLGDHAGAAAFLLNAAELSPEADVTDAHHRQLQAAIELEMAGDVVATADIARRLIDALPRSAERARARQLLMYCTEPTYEDGLDELAIALRDAEDDPAMQAELLLTMAETCNATCRLPEAIGFAERAIDVAERAGAEAIAVTALSEIGIAGCLQGLGVTEASRTAHARWDPAYASPYSYSPQMALACSFLYTEAFEEAEELLREELALADERGIEPVEVIARGLLAECELRAGRWSDSLTDARRSHEHARQAANPQIIAASSYGVAMTQAMLGQVEAAREISTPSLETAEAMHDFWFINYHRSVLGLVALTEADPEAAIDALEPAWTLMTERGLGEFSIFGVAPVLGEALVDVGRLEEAADVADTLRASPAIARPWCRAMAGRLDGLVASARGDHVAARGTIAAALEAHADLPEPFEHARTLHIAGRIERGARNWGAARVALVDALERFDQLGAARWSEKTAADLARLPGRRPVDKRELTTREREVAELAASGLANKEIAKRLFVSVNTVEKTLSKTYAKLGVRSRTELARKFPASTAPTSNL